MSYFGYPLYPLTPATQQNQIPIVGSTTLGAGAATYSKAFIITGAGGYTITLPAIDAVNFPTASFSIYNNSSAPCTVNVAGSTSDTMLLLGASYTSVSILPGERFLIQNMLTSWVIALESASRTTTAPQFDNTIRSASTAFVQRSLGNRSNIKGINTNYIAVAADVGKVIAANVAGLTLTLPLSTSLPPGSTIGSYANIPSGIMSFAVQGSDKLNTGGTGQLLTTASIYYGESCDWITDGAGNWYAVGRSAFLGNTGSFGASFNGNGYQKLPSGLLIQWGSNTAVNLSTTQTNPVTFPIAFPSGPWTIYTTYIGAQSSVTIIISQTVGVTATGFSWMSNYTGGNMTAQWLAIGR